MMKQSNSLLCNYVYSMCNNNYILANTAQDLKFQQINGVNMLQGKSNKSIHANRPGNLEFCPWFSFSAEPHRFVIEKAWCSLDRLGFRQCRRETNENRAYPTKSRASPGLLARPTRLSFCPRACRASEGMAREARGASVFVEIFVRTWLSLLRLRSRKDHVNGNQNGSDTIYQKAVRDLPMLIVMLAALIFLLLVEVYIR